MLNISRLEELVGHLNSKLDGMTKFVRMLNFGTEGLYEILGVGKSSKDMNKIGCFGETSNPKTMFVPPI